jgi:predicted metal-dependent HD superfamily phosphohydrolase
MTAYSALLNETESYIQQYFASSMPDKYVFHDLEHTLQTVASAKVIGEGYELSEEEMAIVQLSMLFHDTGYKDGPPDHEERSCVMAEDFLKGKITEQECAAVYSCIRATKVPQKPGNLLEKICCDADLAHLGMESYWDRNGKLRQEFVLSRNHVMRAGMVRF